MAMIETITVGPLAPGEEFTFSYPAQVAPPDIVLPTHNTHIVVHGVPTVDHVTFRNTGATQQRAAFQLVFYLGSYTLAGTKADTITPMLWQGAGNRRLEPAGFEDYMDLRQYVSYVDPLLTNLAANPSIRTGIYATVALHCMVADFGNSQLSLLQSCMARAKALTPPMPIYPAARVFPGNQFSDWVNRAYWEGCAANFEILAGFRSPDDPRIGIDCENYLTQSEPTLAMLSAQGYTLEQFREAIQPFVDKMRDLNAVVCVYPQVVANTQDQLNQFIVALLDTLGPEGVQVWWEDSFGLSEKHRKNRTVGWSGVVAQMFINEACFERHYGVSGLKHRHVMDDDVLRSWGEQSLEAIDFMGRIRPWIFDRTRIDRTSWGKPEAVSGTSIKSVNDVMHAWAWIPLPPGSPSSVGIGNPIALIGHRGTADTLSAGSCSVPDADGVRMVPPEGYTYAGSHARGVHANRWDAHWVAPGLHLSDTVFCGLGRASLVAGAI